MSPSYCSSLLCNATTTRIYSIIVRVLRLKLICYLADVNRDKTSYSVIAKSPFALVSAMTACCNSSTAAMKSPESRCGVIFSMQCMVRENRGLCTTFPYTGRSFAERIQSFKVFANISLICSEPRLQRVSKSIGHTSNHLPQFAILPKALFDWTIQQGRQSPIL